MRADHVRAEAGSRSQRTQEGERLRLALHLNRLELLVVEDALRLAVCLHRAGDPVHRCCSLQAGCRVDDVARDHPLALFGTRPERHDGLARIDADPHLQRERRILIVQLPDRLQDPEPGTDGTLRVVLVRHWGAEDRHDRVSDELLHGAAVTLDLLPQAGVVGADAGTDVLGVSRFRGGREADEVAEEDGHDLALLVYRRLRLRGQRRRTERAERELSRELLTARSACRHPRSLRRSGPPPRGRRFSAPSLQRSRFRTKPVTS